VRGYIIRALLISLLYEKLYEKICPCLPALYLALVGIAFPAFLWQPMPRQALTAPIVPTVPILAKASIAFTIEDFQIDYYLDRTSDGRSSLKTVESITALFPASDQNHGIERAIPAKYDGHPTHLRIDSVVDQSGRAHSFTTYGSGDNTVVRIGDADTYVHGTKKTYKTHLHPA